MCAYFCLHRKVLSTLYVSNAALLVHRFFSQTGIFCGFSPYIINLAGSSLQIFSESITLDERMSSEAAMGGGGAQRSCAPVKTTVKNGCVQRIGASAAKTH
jgi:hypothetical protein